MKKLPRVHPKEPSPGKAPARGKATPMTGDTDSRDVFIADLAEEKTRLAADLAQIRRSAAIFDVARERTRQVEDEGWVPEHDDAHGDGSLALAGACYAMFASVSDEARAATDMPAELTTDGEPIAGWAAWLSIWPWERRFWKPTDRRRDLVKAAALLVAEIERIDRAAITADGSHRRFMDHRPGQGEAHGPFAQMAVLEGARHALVPQHEKDAASGCGEGSMKLGHLFISTGFYRSGAAWRHYLLALHRRWRFAYVRPAGKPDYRRLYIGPLEIEWSNSPISSKGISQ